MTALVMNTRPAKARQKPKRPQPPSLREETTLPLKVVIRRLPPHLPEAVFQASISEWHKSFELFYYVPGKLATKRDETDQSSRAYVKFRKHDDLQAFVKHYQNHLFVSSTNQEYRASIDIALFQKTAKPPSAAVKAKDPLAGTIEQDPDYLAFVESLKAPVVRNQASDVQSESKVTPLIEYLRVQKAKSDARSKVRKAKDAAAKAKEQEEKRKAAQALADATSAKMREKAATAKGKGTMSKSTPKESKSEHGSSAPAKTKARGQKPKSAAPVDRASVGQTVIKTTPVSKPMPQKAPSSSLAQQRIPKGQVSSTRPAQLTEKKANDKAPNPSKKNKRKEPRQAGVIGNGKGPKSTGHSGPVDISGPTPAEMAALARANIT